MLRLNTDLQASVVSEDRWRIVTNGHLNLVLIVINLLLGCHKILYCHLNQIEPNKADICLPHSMKIKSILMIHDS